MSEETEMAGQHLRALKAAKSQFEFFGNDKPKCPHCGADFEIDENERWDLYSEESHRVDCPSCEQEYQVISRASWSFSTDDQDEQDDD